MRRTMIVTIISSILFVVAVVLVVVLVEKKPDEETQTNINVPQGTIMNGNTVSDNTNEPRELTEEEKQRIEVTRIATIFGEQYGTYTGSFSQSNLDALESIITSSLDKQLQASIINSASGTQIETQVTSVELVTFTQSSSSVASVSTLRYETDTEGSESVVSQDVALQLVYSESEWKVQSAQWKEPQTADLL